MRTSAVGSASVGSRVESVTNNAVLKVFKLCALMQIRYTALSMLNPQSRDSSGERATRNKHPRVSPAELPLQAPRRCFIFTNEGQRHGGLPLTFNIPNATSAKDLRPPRPQGRKAYFTRSPQRPR